MILTSSSKKGALIGQNWPNVPGHCGVARNLHIREFPGHGWTCKALLLRVDIEKQKRIKATAYCKSDVFVLGNVAKTICGTQQARVRIIEAIHRHITKHTSVLEEWKNAALELHFSPSADAGRGSTLQGSQLAPTFILFGFCGIGIFLALEPKAEPVHIALL
jgi:hypothetical protein